MRDPGEKGVEADEADEVVSELARFFGSNGLEAKGGAVAEAFGDCVKDRSPDGARGGGAEERKAGGEVGGEATAVHKRQVGFHGDEKFPDFESFTQIELGWR